MIAWWTMVSRSRTDTMTLRLIVCFVSGSPGATCKISHSLTPGHWSSLETLTRADHCHGPPDTCVLHTQIFLFHQLISIAITNKNHVYKRIGLESISTEEQSEGVFSRADCCEVVKLFIVTIVEIVVRCCQTWSLLSSLA